MTEDSILSLIPHDPKPEKALMELLYELEKHPDKTLENLKKIIEYAKETKEEYGHVLRQAKATLDNSQHNKEIMAIKEILRESEEQFSQIISCLMQIQAQLEKEHPNAVLERSTLERINKELDKL